MCYNEPISCVAKPHICGICASIVPLIYLLFEALDNAGTSWVTLVFMIIACIITTLYKRIHVSIYSVLLMCGIMALSLASVYNDRTLAVGVIAQSAYHTWYICRYSCRITDIIVQRTLNVAVVMCAFVLLRRSLYYNVSTEFGVNSWHYVDMNDGISVLILVYRVAILVLNSVMLGIITHQLRRYSPVLQ